MLFEEKYKTINQCWDYQWKIWNQMETSSMPRWCINTNGFLTLDRICVSWIVMKGCSLSRLKVIKGCSPSQTWIFLCYDHWQKGRLSSFPFLLAYIANLSLVWPVVMHTENRFPNRVIVKFNEIITQFSNSDC